MRNGYYWSLFQVKSQTDPTVVFTQTYLCLETLSYRDFLLFSKHKPLHADEN